MMNNAFIVLLGFGTVFFGLICLVFIIVIMGKLVAIVEKKRAVAEVAAPVEDDSELVAVITAALAQDLGTDTNSIVIRSIKSSD